MPGSDPTTTEPVERFKPTSGALHGYFGLAICAFGIGYVALAEQTLTGLRIALGLATFAVLVWISTLRPRATLYPEHLLLKNSLVDVRIPLRLVQDIVVTRTLNVWAGGKRYVCIGIGKPLRSLFQGSRASKSAAAGLFGAGSLHAYAERGDRVPADQTATGYETFVARRIQEQVDEARSTPASAPEKVRHLAAWPEIAALAVTASAFVVSLLV